MTFSYGTEREAGMYGGTAQKIEARIRQWIEDGYTPMAQYFAAKDGVVFLDGAQGMRAPDESGEPLLTDSIFPVASITKTFTGALVMILSEDGLLAPTDRVYRHIPAFRGEGKETVTIAHLMTHSAGIDDDDIWDMPKDVIDAVEISAENAERYPHLDKRFYAACALPLKRGPGVEMSYSSFSQNLVGEILQRVSGKTLRALMYERLFEPLQMKNTFFYVPEDVRDRVVRYPEGAYFGSSMWGFDHPSASGGAYSTARDLCTFGQMLLNGGEYGGARILSRLSVEAMTRNQIPGVVSHHENVFFREAGWGFSFMLSLDKFDEAGTLRSPATFGHSGAGCTMFIADPVNGVVAALMDCTMKNPKDELYERRFDRFFNMVFSGVI